MTDAVVDEVKAWQSRALDPVYLIVSIDCIHVKVREGAVRVKAVYLAIGITMAGQRRCWACGWPRPRCEVLDAGGDGAAQPRRAGHLHRLRRRPEGLPEAIEAVFPQTTVQLCIVHMVRNSLNYVSWKRRPEVAAALKRIDTCATAEEAELRFTEFQERWDDAYAPIGQSWRRNWPCLVPFFDCPPQIRR